MPISRPWCAHGCQARAVGTCGRCLDAAYCSKACLAADWVIRHGFRCTGTAIARASVDMKRGHDDDDDAPSTKRAAREYDVGTDGSSDAPLPVRLADWTPRENTAYEYVTEDILVTRASDDTVRTVNIVYKTTRGYEGFYHPISAWIGYCYVIHLVSVDEVDIIAGHGATGDTRGFGKPVIDKLQEVALALGWGVVIRNVIRDGWLQSLQGGRYASSADGTSRKNGYVLLSTDPCTVIRVDHATVAAYAAKNPGDASPFVGDGPARRLAEKAITHASQILQPSMYSSIRTEFFDGGPFRLYRNATSGFSHSPLLSMLHAYPGSLALLARVDARGVGVPLAHTKMHANGRVVWLRDDADTHEDPGPDAGFLGVYIYHTVRLGSFAKWRPISGLAVTDADVAAAMTLRLQYTQDAREDTLAGRRVRVVPWNKTLSPVAQKWYPGPRHVGSVEPITGTTWFPAQGNFDLTSIRALSDDQQAVVTLRLLYRLDTR